MKYQEGLFDLRESDQLPSSPGSLTEPVRALLGELRAEVPVQLLLLGALGLDGDDEEAFDRLYRNNHVFAGMAGLYGLGRIGHLLEILDFALDLARSKKTSKVHSIDYLAKLLYGRIQGLEEEIGSPGGMKFDLSDLLDESRNYLLSPLLAWNQERDARGDFKTPLPPDVQVLDLESGEPAQITEPAPAPVPVSAASAAAAAAGAVAGAAAGAAAGPVAGAVAGAAAGPAEELRRRAMDVAAPAPLPPLPFDDEAEQLDIPLDKVGMISDFFEENSEILDHFGGQVIEVEHAENPQDRINDLFRMMHTVKGGARLLTIKKIEFLAHNAESLLDRIRKGELRFSAPVVDLLLEVKVCLGQMLDEVASGGPLLTRIAPLVTRIREASGQAAQGTVVAGAGPVTAATAAAAVLVGPIPALPGVPSTTVTAPKAAPSGTAAGAGAAARAGAPALPKSEAAKKASESLRVSSEKLDEVLNTASEIYIGRIRFQNEISAIKSFLKSFRSSTDRASEIEPSRILAKLDRYLPEFSKELRAAGGGTIPINRLAELLGPMVARLLPDNSGREMSLLEELNLNFLTIEEIQKQLQKNLETLEQLSNRLQNGAMSFRMVPISSLFERFPMQLRDLARGIGKQVRMEILGGDTELDKVLINKLADPLLHMLRNSVDHGIEAPADRVSAGKPETGTISLRTYYHGSFAVIKVKDDGKGLDRDRILAKGLEKGLVPEGEGKGKDFSDSEIFDLIFQPGFSTNDTVTALSGRGVGMDVVKTAINQLHGSVEIESHRGESTLFRLKLPLTLAIVKILLVQESFHQFALPILNIEALIAVRYEDIGRIGSRMIYNHQGQTIPVASLSGILDFPQSQFRGDRIQMVVLNDGSRLSGILVDAVAGRQEILVKSLGRFVKKVPFVMGCTILRDSKLVLILDPRQIVETVSMVEGLQLAARAAGPVSDVAQPAILVVDDSAIQRENLKNILKQSNYRVETAENGFDALKASRQRTFAAFCVDIMMPLMDGYEFVERLRKMDAYRKAPVFLITAKDSDERRTSSLDIARVLRKPVDGTELIGLLDSHIMAGAAR